MPTKFSPQSEIIGTYQRLPIALPQPLEALLDQPWSATASAQIDCWVTVIESEWLLQEVR
jgi:hypothetical protein